VDSAAGAASQSAGSSPAALIRSQHAIRHLAAGETPNTISGSYEFEEITEDCDEDGTLTLSGSESYEFADDYTSFSATGNFTSEFDACTEDVVVEASDGTCLLTGSMTGAFDMDFTVSSDDLTSENYSMVLDLTTQEGGLDFVIFGENDSNVSANVEFDLHAEGDSTTEEVAFTGTITIDDVEYDASEDIDTTTFSMDELGCVEVEDADSDGEEDAEPGEEGYDFEDDDSADDDSGDDFTLDQCDGDPAEDDAVNEDTIAALCACADAADQGIEDCENEVQSICSDASTMGECVELVDTVIEDDSEE
jgi:hypothetical protein